MPNLVSSALLMGSYAVGRSSPPDVQELAAVAALGALVVACFRLPSPIRPRGRRRHRRVHALALTAMAGLLGTTGYAQPAPAASAAQATPEATPTPEPSPTPAPLEVHGLVDVVYAFNTNRPADGANFFAGVGTSGKRGAISGTPQTLRELTLTLEHRPESHLIVKLEGRVDDSTADVFSRRERGPDGAPLRTDRQYLLLLAAVATF